MLKPLRQTFFSKSYRDKTPIYAEARVANSTFERSGQKVYSTDLIVSLLNRFDPANNEFSV